MRHEMAVKLQRISDVVNMIVVVLGVLFVVTMLVLSTIGITYQLVSGSALTWSYSLTRLFLPWLAMLSVTVAFKSGEHVAISMAIKYLSPKMLRATQYLNLTFVGLFAVALIWYGMVFFENSTQLFMVSDTLQISHKWTALSIPVCGLIMCVHLLSGVSLVQHLDISTELD
jgi:TRAP-type C4-dicarboxylate transport system permease small subunit